MGRKIRTGALLILVLVMIYTQQAVIYAQNEAEKNMKKTTESENSDGTNGEDKEPEKPGGEEGDKEPELRTRAFFVDSDVHTIMTGPGWEPAP